MNLFINGEKTEMPISRAEEFDALEIEAMFETDVNLHPGKVTIVMATFALRDAVDLSSQTEPPSSDILMDYLGVTDSSLNATDRLWLDKIKPPIHTDTDFFDLCTGTSCLNQILGVLSVPMDFRRSPNGPATLSSTQDDQVVDGSYTPHRQSIRKGTEYHQVDSPEPTTSEDDLPGVESRAIPTFEWSEDAGPSIKYHQEDTTIFLRTEEFARPQWKASRVPLEQDDLFFEEDSSKTRKNPERLEYPRIGIALLASILGNQHVDLQHTLYVPISLPSWRLISYFRQFNNLSIQAFLCR